MLDYDHDNDNDNDNEEIQRDRQFFDRLLAICGFSD
jgi:hypothetical protein